MNDFNIERARFNMVEQQIRPWEVLDSTVLNLFSTLPRERFVPEQWRDFAFADMQIPLGQGQVMLEPKLEARILQALNVKEGEQGLEIGTGSGFFAACMAQLCEHVTSVEIFPELREQAQRNLDAQGIDNVTLIEGDAANGWDDGKQYDVIAVTGSLPELHQGFHRSLRIGGRLALIVGEPPVMEGLLITRVADDQWATESLVDTRVPPLLNADKETKFAV